LPDESEFSPVRVEQPEVLDEQAEPLDGIVAIGARGLGAVHQIGRGEVQGASEHLLLAGVVVVDPGDR
jgi:hypothetical protein